MDARVISNELDDANELRDPRALIAAIRRGDADAFEQLFFGYAARLCDFVYRFVQSRDDAQEIVQELFYKLWRNREQFAPRGTLSDYLYLAAKNGARNWLAHRRIVHQWQARALHEADTNPSADPLDVQFVRNETLADIARLVADLPERRRAICAMRWTQGLSYAQIAQQLGISEKTVETQLNRALHEMRARLVK